MEVEMEAERTDAAEDEADKVEDGEGADTTENDGAGGGEEGIPAAISSAENPVAQVDDPAQDGADGAMAADEPRESGVRGSGSDKAQANGNDGGGEDEDEDEDEDDRGSGRRRQRGSRALERPPHMNQPPRPLTQRDLIERIARAKAFGRQQLGELTRVHRETEQKLRELRSGGPGLDFGKREREAETEVERASKARCTEADADAPDAAPVDAANAQEGGGEVKAEGGESAGQAEEQKQSGMEISVGEDGDVVEPAGPQSTTRTRTPTNRPSPMATNRPSPRIRQDEPTKKRANRMFSMLRGTLQAAKTEQGTARAKAVAAQQQKLEKVDAKLKSDRNKLIEYQRTFVTERRSTELAKRDSIRNERAALDARLLRLTWDGHELALSAFIPTASGPPIFYMPKTHNEVTRTRLRDQQAVVNKRLADSPIMLADPLAISVDELRAVAAAPAAVGMVEAPAEAEARAEGQAEGQAEEAAPEGDAPAAAPAEAAEEADGIVESAMQEEDTLSHMT